MVNLGGKPFYLGKRSVQLPVYGSFKLLKLKPYLINPDVPHLNIHTFLTVTTLHKLSCKDSVSE